MKISVIVLVAVLAGTEARLPALPRRASLKVGSKTTAALAVRGGAAIGPITPTVAAGIALVANLGYIAEMMLTPGTAVQKYWAKAGATPVEESITTWCERRRARLPLSLSLERARARARTLLSLSMLSALVLPRMLLSFVGPRARRIGEGMLYGNLMTVSLFALGVAPEIICQSHVAGWLSYLAKYSYDYSRGIINHKLTLFVIIFFSAMLGYVGFA